jgi:hypothetical protein
MTEAWKEAFLGLDSILAIRDSVPIGTKVEIWGNDVVSALKREVMSGYWFERKGNNVLMLRWRKRKD